MMSKKRVSSMRKLRRRLLLGVLGMFPLIAAAEPASVAADEAVNAAVNKEAPSLELLEFLGDWETEDGEWLDPIQILEELEAESQTAEVEDGSDGQAER